MASGVMLSQAAFEKVNQTVKTVLGEPTQANGDRRGYTQVRPCLVHVTDAIDGEIGRYTGKIILHQNVDATGDLIAADLGDDKGDAVVWCPAEIGRGDANLDLDIPCYPGFIVGWDSDGDAVVVIPAIPLPVGQYQFMVFQQVVDGAGGQGFDFVRAHPVLS